MMNAQQRIDLERALVRADREGVMVAGKGTRKADGAVVYGVTSAKDPTRWYLVLVLPGRLVCNCPARPSAICKHRAITHRAILAERAQLPAAARRAPAMPAAPAQSAPSAPAVRSADDRDTAPLWRHNDPFSIWK